MHQKTQNQDYQTWEAIKYSMNFKIILGKFGRFAKYIVIIHVYNLISNHLCSNQ